MRSDSIDTGTQAEYNKKKENRFFHSSKGFKVMLRISENKTEIEKIASIEAGKTMNVRFVSVEDKKKVDLKVNSLENMISNLDIPINIIDE